MKHLMRTFLIGFISFLTACSAILVGAADPSKDSAAKTFSSVPGRALLYIYRPSKMGGDYTTNVRINGRSLAKGAYQRYNVLSAVPGHYRLEVNAFLYPDKHPLEMDARAGEIHFFEEEWQFGDGFSLREMDPDKAKAVLAQLKLAARVDVVP